MNYMVRYNAPPRDEYFEGPMSAEELRELQADMKVSRPEPGTEFAYHVYDCDLEAVSKAIISADQGEKVYVARDEDGLYFATK